MTTTVVIVIGILILSVISGMLGLGVAFAAVPFLSFFLNDLVNEVQPLSLLLNGVTASLPRSASRSAGSSTGERRSPSRSWRPCSRRSARRWRT